MGTLISFEIKKLFSQKKNILVMLLFIAFIGIYIFANLRAEARSTQRFLDELDIQSRNTQTILNTYSESSDKNSAKEIYYQNKYEMLKKIRFAVSKEDWRERLNLQIQLNELIMQNENPQETQFAELEEEIAIDRILLEKNIEPIDTTCSMLAFNFIALSYSNIMPLLIIMMIAMIGADSISGEYETGTHKPLMTQPMKKSVILFSKYVSNTVVTSGLVAVVFGIAYLLLGLAHGFGSADYPVLLSDGRDMGMGNFVALIIPLILFQIILANAFVLVFSVLFETGSGSIGAAILSFFIIYLLTFSMGNLLYLSVNPVTYLPMADIIKGTSVGNYAQGIIVLPVSAGALYSMALWIFRRKEIV